MTALTITAAAAQASADPSALFFVPSAEFVANLAVGDFVPDCFGRMCEVTSITFRGVDIRGAAFVGFYTRFSDTATMSGDFKVGELHRTVTLSNSYKSAELDAIEAAYHQRIAAEAIDQQHEDLDDAYAAELAAPDPLVRAMDLC